MDPVNVTAKFEVRSSTCSWDNSEYLKTLDTLFKVIDFGTNQKCICDFLLVHHSNLGLSCTVSEILQVFVLLSDPTPIPP